MIRKGLRPRFRIGLEWPDDRYPYRRVLPFRRSWIAIGVLLVFDLIFLYPAITTFQQAASEWESFDNLFDLVTAIFMSAWLLGWMIAPLLMTLVLAVMLFGREVIRAKPGELQLFLGLPGFGVIARYETQKVRNLVHVPVQDPPDKKSGHSWRGAHVSFDYGANSVTFGSAIEAADAADIKNHIEMVSGTQIRRGEALPDEMHGDWEPDPLTLISKLDSPEPVSPAAKRPITLASPSALALIAANLVPLAGTVFLGWRLSDVMVLYWAESAVIGFFNICKIIAISRWAALLAAPFFIGHFGGFMAVHFMFIYGIFIEGPNNLSGGNLAEVGRLFIDLWPALAALFVSHALSFFSNFVAQGEHRGRTLKHQMSEPYSRIVFMHLVLIFGGGLTLIIGESTPVLLLVIAVKIIVDVRTHLREHDG